MSIEKKTNGAHHNQRELSLHDDGKWVTLSNSLVSVTIEKSSAEIKALSYKGGPNLMQNGGGGYYILNYVKDGKRQRFAPKHELNYRVAAQDEAHLDIALYIEDQTVMPYHYEIHFAVVQGEPGVYVYSIMRYPEEVPGGNDNIQGRYGFRVDPEIFKYYAVDDTRKGPLPTLAEMEQGVQVMDATFKLANGEVYTKYNHLMYEGDLQVTGVYGDELGISIVRPSNEYVGGGPTQQRNTVHQTHTTPILLWHDHESHFGRSNLKPVPGWEKIYGPVMLYINEQQGFEALWADAKAKAAEERQKWPYPWLDHPLYEATSRGEVTGKLEITDGTSPEGAWIILADPEPDWQNQNLGYNFYTRASADGSFTLPNVKPGAYTLYAFVKGQFGEFRYDGINVGPSQSVQLPPLKWTPEKHGQLVWQIGTPDRTAAEYKHGDNFRQWGLWLEYPLDFPNGVDFYIGKSKEQTDWNYAHPVNATPGEPEHVKVPYDKSLAVWKIRFDLDEPLEGRGTLTFGIASSRNGSLHVELNGTVLADLETLPGPQTDSAMPRSSVHGYYRELKVTFDAALLQKGENVIRLRHSKNIFDEQGRRTGDLYASIMYDAIRLEVE